MNKTSSNGNAADPLLEHCAPPHAAGTQAMPRTSQVRSEFRRMSRILPCDGWGIAKGIANSAGIGSLGEGRYGDLERL